MSVAEARRVLDARMRRVFDKHACGWSQTDAQAVRVLLADHAAMKRRRGKAAA
jgi:hypothetical protein